MIGKLLEWWLRFREPRQLQIDQPPTEFVSSSSSSSSSSSMQQRHQVFLSFRGEDTRCNFTSHLHTALQRRGIGCFIDYQLERGEKISPALLTAIEQSMISIIVLSKNYASSSWCLDELFKILECKEGNGQMVIPIFYHVDPSDVRKQTGSFAKAFVKHVKKRADKVDKWKTALKEVGNLSGWHLHGQPNDRPESQHIEEIVEEVSKKLMSTSSYDTEGLIGINCPIEQIESLLCFGSKDVRFIGIWGMGGIGKTTIAEVVYNRFFAKFEGCCFLPNVKENYGRGHLQDELFSKILEDSNLNASTSSLPAFIKQRLQHKKVLIVLDDVDDPKQLDLLPKKCWFGVGSRIIVTSRDKQVLRQVVNDEMMYEVEGLVDDEALQLFRLYAFKKCHPEGDFMELSKKVVHYAKGVPLALRVLGSHLYSKNKSFWENELNKLEEIPNPQIDNVMRISYDELDRELKDIFLDIACFQENNKDYIKNILDSCYKSGMSRVSVLIDKSLLTLAYNTLEMHDLLRQMGWNIVHQESKEAGRRSRLWTPKDIYHVLKNNTGTEMVEGMFLDMSKIRPVGLSSTTFARMYNLKLLKFYYADFAWKREMKVYLSQGDLESLPDNLHLLHWDNYPSKSLPSNFCPHNLVELCMPNSHIEKLWNGVQDLVKLKRLDLRRSLHLIEIPDLSRANALEYINLDGCRSLVEVSSSIGCLSKLTCLSISHHCGMLDYLPRGICHSNITKFPETPRNLRKLNLSGTAIEQVPSSIECLSQLEELHLGNCVKLSSLPRYIYQSKSLLKLDVSGFSKVEVIQELLGNVQVLVANGTAAISIDKFRKELCVSSCLGFVELIDDFDDLENLKCLFLINCNLVAFPNFFTRLSSFTKLVLSRNRFETIPASIAQLLNLRILDLSHCKSLQTLPASIKQLLNLKFLKLNYCERLQLLPELPPHLHLDASDCTSLEAVSSLFPICHMSCDHQHKNPSTRYLFTNCINLDQNTIWAKTQRGIQQLATEDVKDYHHDVDQPKVYNYILPSFSICLSGSEIPEWFSFQNEGSSVTIQLPPHLHDDKFVGFALCTVLASDNSSLDFPLVQCQYNFKTDGDFFKFVGYSVPQNYDGSDIVCVHYAFDLYRHYYEEIGYHPNVASFKFSDQRNSGMIIKKCGVCLLYAQDDLTDYPHRPSEECNPLMIQPSSPYDPTQLSLKCGVISQDFVEPMVEEISTTTKRPLDDDYCNDEAECSWNFRSDEEQEPHPKRLKL